MVRPELVTREAIKGWRGSKINTVVLMVDGTNTAKAKQAIALVRDENLGLRYWIEVGRDPTVADQHPEWMSSLQGHPEWQKKFPEFPKPAANQVPKAYPWTPILYKESFEAHLTLVKSLLESLPPADYVFLNDLQGGPSACGCGNDQCRWTTDYGDKTTATKMGPDAAANFMHRLKGFTKDAGIIPAWTTECEIEDKHERCAGVGCFDGICWKSYTEQLMPMYKEGGIVAPLILPGEFHRLEANWGKDSGWTGHALKSFQMMPPLRGGKAIPADRLIPILQGWDQSLPQIKAQIGQVTLAGSRAYVIAYSRVDQSWNPRMYTIPAK